MLIKSNYETFIVNKDKIIDIIDKVFNKVLKHKNYNKTTKKQLINKKTISTMFTINKK